MPIQRLDQEIEEITELPHAPAPRPAHHARSASQHDLKAAVQTLPVQFDATKDLADVSDAVSRAVAELGAQVDLLRQWTTGPVAVPGAPAEQGESSATLPIPDTPDAVPLRDFSEDPPAAASSEPSSSQLPSSLPAPNSASVPSPDSTRDFSNRLNAALPNVGNYADSGDDTQRLLERAISVIEGIAQHPGLRNAPDMERRLENIENQLGSSGNV